MPAFSYAVKGEIENNIRIMYARLRAVSFKSLTNDDFLRLFVPAVDREMYGKMIGKVQPIHCHAHYEWLTGTDLVFTLRGAGGLIPTCMALQPDAPADLLDAITKWTQQGGDASGDCGRVMKLFEVLNEKCSKQQMRFLWPSILTILGLNDEKTNLKQLAIEMQELKAPKKPPELPMGVMQACRRTSETVAMCSLIPHDVLSRPTDEGAVVLRTLASRSYSEPGLGHFIGMGN